MVAGVRSIDVFFFCRDTLTDFPFLLSRLVWDRTPLNRPFRNGLWPWRATEKRTARWWINFTTTRRRFVIGCQSLHPVPTEMHIDIVWISLNVFHSFAVYLVTISISAPLKSYSPSEYNGKFYRAPPLRVFHLRPTHIPHRPSPLKRFKPRSTQLPFFYHFHPVSRDYVNDDSLVSMIDEILVNGMNRVIHTNLVECNSIRRKDNNYPFGSSEIVESFAN